MKKQALFLFTILGFCSLHLRSQNLTIDFANGINSNHPGGGSSYKVAIDPLGHSYIAGVFQGITDFDPSGSTANLTSLGDADGYLAKYDQNGGYIWAIGFGTAGYDQCRSVAVDDSGGVYITGYFTGTMDMDPGPGIANISALTSSVYVAKYDDQGNYLWAFVISGPSPTAVYDLCIDANANIYITGTFGNTVDFDPSGGIGNLTMGTGSTYDMYMAKYDSSGNYIWARGLNTVDAGTSNAIAVDVSGNVYIGGVFNGTVDFDPGVGTANLNCSNPGNIFLAKYNSLGNYTWAQQIGDAANNEAILDLTIDGIGNVVATGSFQGTNPTDFNPGAGTDNHTPYSAVYTDGFVAKYSPAGIHIWAHPFGGSNNDFGLGVTTDAARNVYVTGYFNDSVDFDPTMAISALIADGIYPDVFIAKYSLTGGLVWAERIGGSSVEDARSITVDNNGELWITGTFQSPLVDFDPSAGTYPVSAAGAGTIFLAKYDYCSPVNLNEVSHTDVSCFNGNSGAIHLHADGTGPFIFNWQPAGGTDSIAVNLTVGSYTCTVTSACGTISTISAIISQPDQLDPFIVSQTNVFCNGDSSGTAEVDAIGGVTPYDFSWIPGGMTTSAVSNLTAGVYTCTVTDDNACMATQTITIAQPSAIEFNQSPYLCSGDSIVVGGNIYSTTGIYVDVFTALNGCDSTVTTNLTVHPVVNTSVGLTGTTLTANASPATYQWVDCINSFLPVAGETFSIFVPAVNGDYAVIVTQNGCADTSVCYLINSVGIDNITSQVQIYPNPFQDYFTINSLMIESEVFITDVNGKEVKTIFIQQGNIRTFYPEAPAGVYFVYLRGNSNSVFKIIKQ